MPENRQCQWGTCDGTAREVVEYPPGWRVRLLHVCGACATESLNEAANAWSDYTKDLEEELDGIDVG